VLYSKHTALLQNFNFVDLYLYFLNFYQLQVDQ
jgi:hypothetical protein